METRNYWEENGHAAVKYDNYNSNDDFSRGGAEPLGFTAPSEDEGEYQNGNYLKKGKVSRQQDPMSHRIIEKRRRDRMNNCLADLSRLIPPEYLKKGRGRVEKTEIIEMAIRHLKFLQERANGLNHANKPDYVAERQVGDFHAGYQEAVSEAVRYLCEVHGYAPGDGLCVQLAAHLQRHCEHITKSDNPMEKIRTQPSGSSSETASSSGSSRGYTVKGVIATVPPPAPPTYPPDFEPEPEPSYAMDCDRVSAPPTAPVSTEASPSEPLPLDGRRRREPALRAIRKPDHDDYLHSYKFKNSIERRFSRSQDSEVNGEMATDAITRAAHAQVSLGHAHLHSHMHAHSHGHARAYTHKRRRAAKLAPAPSTSTSASVSTEDTRDNSPQETSSESPHNHHHYEKPAPPVQFVPVFALNALGKYYVPLSIDYACLARHLGPYDMLDARAVHIAAPLHPVTIHVNFQPCLNYHVKREPSEREWRPV